MYNKKDKKKHVWINIQYENSTLDSVNIHIKYGNIHKRI